MILAAYGILDYSPIQVSEFLRRLRMSHTLEGGIRHLTHTLDGLCKEQPLWPIVVDKVKAVTKLRTQTARTVLLVCDSRAALSTTNLCSELWPENRGPDMVEALKRSFIAANRNECTWSLTNDEPSTLDYVNSATKPSFVNGCQSALYRITPYALRKEVQQLMISYLAGSASYTAMHKKLASSLKLQDLSALLHLPKAKELREAVMMLRNYSVEEVAKQTGFETFELLYISKSSAKTSTGAKK
jgi:hypothetical protein